MGLSTMPSALPSILASAFLVPGILALLIRDPRRSRFVGFGGGAVASFLGLVVTLIGTMRGTPMHIPLPAPVPWAASELFIDGLSAYFLALIFFIGFLVSVYAIGYSMEVDEVLSSADELDFRDRPLAPYWEERAGVFLVGR